MSTEFSDLTPGGVTFAVSLQLGKVPSDDPIAFGAGFKEGLTSPDAEPVGEDLAEGYIKGYRLAMRIRNGKASMPSWAKVTTGTIPPPPTPEETQQREQGRATVAELRALREPWFPEGIIELDLEIFPIPNLSDVGIDEDRFEVAVDEEGDEVEALFVDHSGFGQEGERALTQKQFIERLKADIEAKKGYGYAITDIGQFQLYCGVYQRKE